MMTVWMAKEMLVVRPRFVFSFLPDSNRLSSNIGCLPAEHYEILRHQPPPGCSQLWGEFRLSKRLRTAIQSKPASKNLLSVFPLALSASIRPWPPYALAFAFSRRVPPPPGDITAGFDR